MGLRALVPVTVFLFTFLILVLIESYSIGSQEILREEKIGEMEIKTRELQDAHLLTEFTKGTEALIEKLSKPGDFKGILGKMMNNPKISGLSKFFSCRKITLR